MYIQIYQHKYMYTGNHLRVVGRAKLGTDGLQLDIYICICIYVYIRMYIYTCIYPHLHVWRRCKLRAHGLELGHHRVGLGPALIKPRHQSGEEGLVD